MSTSTFVCALSGETPIADPVVLPTGQICSKRLLLKKLTETSNTNPFNASLQVDESQLIDLLSTGSSITGGGSEIIPPRSTNTSNSNSIPSILNNLANEYDSLVLELFDTRKALEETRQELSQALYQNDAAIRVIARVVLERDVSRRELAAAATASTAARDSASAAAESGDTNSNKRKRGNDDNVNVVPEDDADTETAANSSPIPTSVKAQLKEKWNNLYSVRKAKTKAGSNYATPQQVATYSPIQKISHHKTNAKGITALVGDALDKGDGTDSTLVTCSKVNKQVTLYNIHEDKVMETLLTKKDEKTNVEGTNMISCVGNVIAFVGTDGLFRVFIKSDGNGEGESQSTIAIAPIAIGQNENDSDESNTAGVAVHPTGQHVFVAETNGTIRLFEINIEQKSLAEVSVWNVNGADNDNADCACIALHPDGLILAIGRKDGKVNLWDLQAEKMATTFEASGANDTVAAISFSQKGVHLAAAHDNGMIHVWDLRKQKAIASVNAESSVGCLSFCPVGKYLAYGTANGNVVVTVVKDWDKKLVLGGEEENGKGAVSGLLWGKDAKTLTVSYDGDRVIKVWGEDKEKE